MLVEFQLKKFIKENLTLISLLSKGKSHEIGRKRKDMKEIKIY